MAGVMHRAQINLEDWQYQKLKSHARRARRSVSAVVRAIVAAHFEADGKPASFARGLGAIAGIGKSGRRSAGEDHDDIYDAD